MNDPEIHKYIEQRYKKHSLADIRKFVVEKINLKMSFYSEFLLRKGMKIYILVI